MAKARRSEGAGAHLRDGSDKNVLFDATKSKLLYLWKYYFMVDSQPGMEGWAQTLGLFAETQMGNRSDPVRRSAHLKSVGREQGVDDPG